MNETPPTDITPPPILTRRALLQGALGGIAAAATGLRPESKPAQSPALSAQEADRFLATTSNSLQETIIAALSKPQENSLIPLVAGTAMAAAPTEQAEKTSASPYLLPDYDPSIADQYLTPEQHDQPRSPARRRLLKTLAAGAGAIVLEQIAQRSGILNNLFGKTKEALAQQFKQVEAAPVTYDSAKVFTEKQPLPSPSPKPIERPTIEPTRVIKERIGDKNVAEFFLGDLVDQCHKRRLQRVANDPGTAERIQPELLHAQTLNFLYLGTDQTRERPNDDEIGRSDVVMFISFNPHTLETKATSFPRDLFVPEVNAIKYNGQSLAGGRINGITVAHFVDKSISEFDLAKQVVESATGAPVDGVIKTNIDFMQGFEEDGIPSIFDSLFPEGLTIDIPKRIVDSKYPAAYYATKTITFEPGPQVLRGKNIVEYARTRHVDSDFQRGDRQRQILFAAAKSFLPNMLKDFLTGGAASIDAAVAALEEQKANNNLSCEIDIAEILKTIKDRVVSMRKSVSGTAALGILAANTGGVIDNLQSNDESMFAQFGINPANGAVGEKILTGAYQLPGSNVNARPSANNNYLSYWKSLRERLKVFFLGDTTNNSIETAPAPPPPKEERILYPSELSHEEVQPYIGRLRSCTDAVITESLFTKEVAAMPPDQRKKVLTAIAKAHAQALFQHYGDNTAIIGIDPGHGGSEGGSAATKTDGGSISEKDLNWEVCQMIAEEIYNLTQGKYTVVFLRPEAPNDKDLNKDGAISTIERLQKRKAQLVKAEEELRILSPWEKGKNIVYVSVHFNGSSDSNARGTETYYPNEVGMENQAYRESSKTLAEKLQADIVAAIKEAGYPTTDRGIKKDPYTVQPTSHGDTGNPYIMLDSPKLDWDPADPTRPYNKAA